MNYKNNAITRLAGKAGKAGKRTGKMMMGKGKKKMMAWKKY